MQPVERGVEVRAGLLKRRVPQHVLDEHEVDPLAVAHTLLQPGVFSDSLSDDRGVRIGVLPQGEQIRVDTG